MVPTFWAFCPMSLICILSTLADENYSHPHVSSCNFSAFCFPLVLSLGFKWFFSHTSSDSFTRSRWIKSQYTEKLCIYPLWNFLVLVKFMAWTLIYFYVQQHAFVRWFNMIYCTFDICIISGHRYIKAEQAKMDRTCSLILQGVFGNMLSVGKGNHILKFR